MKNTLARIRVLLNAAPTALVVAAVIVTAVSSEIADAFPGNAATWATKIGGWVLAVIGAATAIVRRVVPVLPEDRGLLTPPPKADPIIIDGDDGDDGDDGTIGVSEALVIAILIIVLLFVVTRLF